MKEVIRVKRIPKLWDKMKDNFYPPLVGSQSRVKHTLPRDFQLYFAYLKIYLSLPS